MYYIMDTRRECQYLYIKEHLLPAYDDWTIYTRTSVVNIYFFKKRKITCGRKLMISVMVYCAGSTKYTCHDTLLCMGRKSNQHNNFVSKYRFKLQTFELTFNQMQKLFYLSMLDITMQEMDIMTFVFKLVLMYYTS